MKKNCSVFLLLFIISISSLSFGTVVNVTEETDTLENSTVIKKECANAWIIVGGDRSDHAASDLVLRTCEWVYDRLLDCGYSDELIYFLAPDIEKDNTAREDNITSDAALSYAIRTWADTKVPSNGALGIYMHDHGGSNYMCITPSGHYTATEFDADLDAFEANSGCDRIFIVYEACDSGSFLDEPSKSNRIILTSTDPSHSAWWSPVYPHISIFGEGFFNSILAGNSVGDAFIDATDHVDALGYGDDQFPCIEDNHDGVGHIVNAWGSLPSTGDGNDALNTYICSGCPPVTFWIPPLIYKMKFKWWLPFSSSIMVPVSVKILNTTPLEKVICRIVPENWIPPRPPNPEVMGTWDTDEFSFFQWELTYQGGDNWSGSVEILQTINNSNYRINFIMADANNGTLGKVGTTWLGINGDGKAPPDTINPDLYITNPANGARVEGIVNITAMGMDDQELDNISLYIDDVLVNTTTMPDYLPYPNLVYSWNTSAYSNGAHTLKAVATDASGNINTTSIIVNVGPGIPSFQITIVIIGCLLAVLTFQALKHKKPESIIY